jgi:hypothetical protein
MKKHAMLAVALVAMPCEPTSENCFGRLAAGQSPKQTALPPEIFGHWVHSYEEDAGGTKVYRPAGSKFPPSRGRAGFEIKKGGDFLDHPIAPADGNESIPGTWKLDTAGKVIVTFRAEGRKNLEFRVVACDGKVLKVK